MPARPPLQLYLATHCPQGHLQLSKPRPPSEWLELVRGKPRGPQMLQVHSPKDSLFSEIRSRVLYTVSVFSSGEIFFSNPRLNIPLRDAISTPRKAASARRLEIRAPRPLHVAENLRAAGFEQPR